MLFQWGRMFHLRFSLSDDAWTDGEERTYLIWNYIEVPRKILDLEEGENTEFMEKNR
jgi:hypothetical protein